MRLAEYTYSAGGQSAVTVLYGATRLVSADAATLPLYNAYGFRIGNIPLAQALEQHGTDLEVRAKGTGRRRHFTSAKLYARTQIYWTPKLSAGYLVLQLVRE